MTLSEVPVGYWFRLRFPGKPWVVGVMQPDCAQIVDEVSEDYFVEGATAEVELITDVSQSGHARVSGK